MMKELYKKYHIPVLIIILMLGIGFILSFFYLLIFDKDSTFQNDYYLVSYDSSWHITKKDNNLLELSHGKGTLTFNILELTDNKVYYDIDSLIDDIKYDIEKNNNSYKLLSKDKVYITKNHFIGYTYLYENKNNNVKVSIYKDSKYIVIVSYEANKDYYDLLLDSANSIIYSFKLQDKKYDFIEKLDIKAGKIIYSNSVDYKNLDDTYIDEISNYNYVVNYNLPKAYQSNSYNSLYGSYTYKGFNDYLKSSNLKVNIYNRNIYEYIKDDSNDSLYQKYNSIRSNNNYKENIEKVDNKDNFIYKNSYVIPSTLGDNFYENMELVYSLDRNHILVISFENKNTSISEELKNSIKINYYHNIANYVNRNEVNNRLVSILKDKTMDINISVPIEYKEQGHKDNIYEKRIFVNNYDDYLETYKNIVEYQLYSNEKYALSSINSLVETNKNNGNYHKLTLEGNKKINDKEFKVYKANFVAKTGIFYQKTYESNIKLLIYKLASDKVLCIKITVNNDHITDSLINELIDFNINNK